VFPHKRRLHILFGLGAVLLLSALIPSAYGQGIAPAIPNRVLVKFTIPAADPALREIQQAMDIVETRAVGGNGAFVLVSRSLDTFTLIRRLSARPDVLYAEPDYEVRAIATPNDAYYSQLWGMPKIGAPAAWDTTTGSRSTVVAVVDTGIDYTHPDLADNVWSAPNSFTVTFGSTRITCPAGTHGFNAIKMTCDPMDDNDHGTHVSGTIGAIGNNSIGVAGVNWTASVMGTKFLGASGSGSTSDAVNAIEFAIQAKQAGVANVRVLSNSWGGGGYSETLYNEIARANANGILFVAAAGNNGTNNDTTPSYPAGYEVANVIAVAASDSNDALASWSNYGATSVDLAAPGVNIVSTVRGAKYATYSGTSMATPHVSGAAALILSVCALDTAALKSGILSNVDAVAGLAGKVATGGRLNVAAALGACAGGAPPPAVGDFSLSATPASATVSRGASASYIITVTPSNGFTGTVSFSIQGLPNAAKAGFTPATVTGGGTVTMAVTTRKQSKAGTYTLTVTGSSGTSSQTTSVTLVLQ
jgi:serine protease